MIKRILSFTVLTMAIALPLSSVAHHSHATLDMNDVRIYKGVVKKYGWAMPHVYLKVMAPDADGNIVEYSIEMQHPPAMAQVGWSKTTWKPGDRIIWEGPHDKNPNRHYTGLNWAETGDGTRVGVTKDGPQEVSPSTDFTGLWKRSDPGGFKPHYTPPTDWPLSDKGQALVDNFHEDQNPMVTCGNPGPPKAMIVPYPVVFTRPDDDTLVMERELMEDLRIVHFNHDAPVGPPSKMGHSIGYFEGDTLVVETHNFIDDDWGIHTGISSSNEKQLLERFTLYNDGLNLKAEITVTDPVYLSKPHTFAHHWRKLPDRPVIQAPCTMEAATLYLNAGNEKE